MDAGGCNTAFISAIASDQSHRSNPDTVKLVIKLTSYALADSQRANRFVSVIRALLQQGHHVVIVQGNRQNGGSTALPSDNQYLAPSNGTDIYDGIEKYLIDESEKSNKTLVGLLGQAG